MKNLIQSILRSNALIKVLPLFFLTSCATVMSNYKYPYSVITDPPGALVVIKNEAGEEVYSGLSPTGMELKASGGFFKRAAYTLTISMDGYKEKTFPINFKLDEWYFGNLVLGGWIGMFFIDPITGAMYKIEDSCRKVYLFPETAGVDGPVLKVYDIADVPPEWAGDLVRIVP